MAEKVSYELTAAEADLLATVSQEANAAAGEWGGGIGRGEAGASGARRGGSFGSRFTKAHTAQSVVDLPYEREGALESVRNVIAEIGALIDDPNRAGDGSVWGIIGSGVMDMMPALVRVQVEARGSGAARVHVRGSGREGLIKQRIGGKAVDRIVEAVQHAQ